MSDESVDTSAADAGVLTGDTPADTGSVLTGDTNTDEGEQAAADTNAAAEDGKQTEGETKVDADGDDTGTGDDDSSSYVLPEGIELTDENKEVVDALISDAELNPAQSQKIIDFMLAQAEEGQKSQDASYEQLIQGWANECKNDAEFGGADFAKNQGVAKAAIDAFGTPELRTMLDEQGMANNPDLFRFMVKVGKTLKEDNPGDMGGHQKAPKDIVSELYPNDNNNKT